MTLEEVLKQFKDGELASDKVVAAVRASMAEDLQHSVVDHDRESRTGAEEVVFGEGKEASQIQDIIDAMLEHGSNVLVTRLDADKYQALKGLPEGAHYHAQSRMLSCVQTAKATPATTITVVTAGTSDIAVAEEAALTAEFFGNEATRIYDVGIAGLHRLLARLDDVRAARVLVVVAGMEGALPSVIGGLVDKPVIAVPTSVGYGAAFDGVAALLGMLTSCASGVSVVNIDNGFGAGYLANTINRL